MLRTLLVRQACGPHRPEENSQLYRTEVDLTLSTLLTTAQVGGSPITATLAGASLWKVLLFWGGRLDGTLRIVSEPGSSLRKVCMQPRLILSL